MIAILLVGALSMNAAAQDAKVDLPMQADFEPIVEAMRTGDLEKVKAHLHPDYFNVVPKEDRVDAEMMLRQGLPARGNEVAEWNISFEPLSGKSKLILAEFTKRGEQHFPEPQVVAVDLSDDPSSKKAPQSDGVFLAKIGKDKWVLCLPTFAGMAKKNKSAKPIRAKGDLAALKSALRIYRGRTKAFPTTEQGLEALVTQPTLAPIPKKWTRLMGRLPVDPWGNPYVYRLTDEGFELLSLGPDGKMSSDDIRPK